MKIKNVSPMGDLDVPLIGRVVAAGETFEVADEDGALLVDQPYHFTQITAGKATKKEGETK
jgi:hypothetical protein